MVHTVKTADLSAVADRINQAIKASPFASRMGEPAIEPVEDDEGGRFLRVLVPVKGTEVLDEAALETLLETIESSVLELDDRYPSVRFLDAA